jgi:hypothetical protein
MASLVERAVRRNLQAAEASGDTERANRYRERLREFEPEEKQDEGEMEWVQFASPAARAAAEEAGLEPKAFKRRRKSSESGFTKADVEQIAGAAGGEDT